MGLFSLFANHLFSSDPPEKLVLLADEITDSSVKLSWRALSQQQHQAASGNNLASATPIDGYVLAFARFVSANSVASRTQANANKQSNFQPLLDLDSLAPMFKQANASSKTSFMGVGDAAARIATNGNKQPALDKQHPSIDQWQAIQLPPQQRSHHLRNLDCGSAYGLKIWALNQVGKGEPSDLIRITTRGKTPVAPDKRSFLSPNSTQVRLQLSAWYDGGCEIIKFIVKYRQRFPINSQQQLQTSKPSDSQIAIPIGDNNLEWILVSNNIPKDQATLIIRDLSPASHYELLVSAQNQVGITEVKYRFSTLDLNGQTIAPSSFNSNEDSQTVLISGNEDAFEDGDFGRDRTFDLRRLDQQWSSKAESSRLSSYLAIVMQQLVQGPMSFVISTLLIFCLLLTFIFYRFNNNSGHTFGSCSSSSSGSSSGAGSSTTTTSSTNEAKNNKQNILLARQQQHQKCSTLIENNNNNNMSSNCYDLTMGQQIPMLAHAPACSLVDSNESSAGGASILGLSNNNQQANLNGLLTDSPALSQPQFGSPELSQQLASQNQADFLDSHYQNAISESIFGGISDNNGSNNKYNTLCANPTDHYQMQQHHLNQQLQLQQQNAYGVQNSVYATVLGGGRGDQESDSQVEQSSQQQQQQCLMQMLLLAGQNAVSSPRHATDLMQCINATDSSTTFHPSLPRRNPMVTARWLGRGS